MLPLLGFCFVLPGVTTYVRPIFRGSKICLEKVLRGTLIVPIFPTTHFFLIFSLFHAILLFSMLFADLHRTSQFSRDFFKGISSNFSYCTIFFKNCFLFFYVLFPDLPRTFRFSGDPRPVSKNSYAVRH